MAKPLTVAEEIENLKKERDALIAKVGVLTEDERKRLLDIGRLIEKYSKRTTDDFEDIIMNFNNRESSRREFLRELRGRMEEAEYEMKRLLDKYKGKRWDEWEKKDQEAYRNAERTFTEGRDLENRNSFTAKIDAVVKGLGTIYDKIKALNDPWAKASQAAADYAKSVGMSSDAMDVLLDKTLKNVTQSKIAGRYNVSTEELLKMQSDYIRGVGRNVRVSGGDQEYMAAMHSVMQGREGELIQQFENFGVNITSVGERVGKMWSDASKAGVSFEKYSDNIAKNMRIAQNYTFRNGLKGLESMAMKATAIRLDMQQVANLAEKVSTVEGAIDVGAKLQVLGGPFAQMADPLGMLNEGLNDMEGLTDRIAKMIGGLGTFNRQTGEVEVSAFNKRRIRAAAEAMGMDPNTIMESVNTQARRGEIDRQMALNTNAAGLKDEVKELIRNIGTFQNGKAGVSINGQFKTLDEISNKDYEALMTESRSDSDNIKDIAQNIRGLLEIRSGVEKARDSWQARMTKHLGTFEIWLSSIAVSTAAILAAIKMMNTVGGIDGIGRGVRGARDWVRRKRTGSAGGAGQAVQGGVDIARERQKYIRSLQPRDANGKWRKATPEEQMRIDLEMADFDRRNAGAGTGASTARGRGARGRIGGMFGKVKGAAGKAAGKVSDIAGKAAGKATDIAGKAMGKINLKGVGKTALKIGSKAAKLGNVAGLVTSIGGDLLTDHLISKGKVKEGTAGYTALKAGNSALQWGAMGATIGSVIPGVGTLIGGAIGALAGGLGGWLMNRPKKDKDKKGGETIIDGPVKPGGSKDKVSPRKKDTGISIVEKTGSHIAGTTSHISPVRGSTGVRRPEKPSEGVRITGATDRGIETSWKKVAPTQSTSAPQYRQASVPSKFDLTLNGTLKLTGEKGQSIDLISELRRNPQVLRSLSDMIAREVSHINRGTNIVHKG